MRTNRDETFGNDLKPPRASAGIRRTSSPSAPRRRKRRAAQARKKADKARSEARREYTEQRTYAEVKAEAKARREREKSARGARPQGRAGEAAGRRLSGKAPLRGGEEGGP